MLFQVIHLNFQFVRQPEVVRIEKGDTVAAGLSNAGITSCWFSGILLMDVLDQVAIFFKYTPSAIGRPVVHDYDLLSAVRLVKNTFEHFFNVPRAVVCWNDYANSVHFRWHCN